MAVDDAFALFIGELSSNRHLPADDVVGDIEGGQGGAEIIGAEGKTAPTCFVAGPQAEPVAIDEPRIDLCALPVGALPEEPRGDIANLVLRSADHAAALGIH